MSCLETWYVWERNLLYWGTAWRHGKQKYWKQKQCVADKTEHSNQKQWSSDEYVAGKTVKLTARHIQVIWEKVKFLTKLSLEITNFCLNISICDCWNTNITNEVSSAAKFVRSQDSYKEILGHFVEKSDSKSLKMHWILETQQPSKCTVSFERSHFGYPWCHSPVMQI
jgi:hypothetical protein